MTDQFVGVLGGLGVYDYVAELVSDQSYLVFLLDVSKCQLVQKQNEVIALGGGGVLFCEVSGEVVCLLYPTQDDVAAAGSLLPVKQHPDTDVYKLGEVLVPYLIDQGYNTGWCVLKSVKCQFPTPPVAKTRRFYDNGDNTITDTSTGLMWTKDANLPQQIKSWQEALDFVASMNTDSGTYGYKDWRLPGKDEFESLVVDGRAWAFEQKLTVFIVILERDRLCVWLKSQGFNNVQSYYYWSSLPTLTVHPTHGSSP
ncbi:protein containing DUF1566 [Candidatus Magnetobacterium bavaricum]|uniref:Protein containing DUF1566 n=1 Tax=Candidatus Magnetobacterium bavaricum TaxID=29290 RepID=A0A0F3GVZ4_9BACT|nr:protein containing DUF1566 [Candidatus Magnetobacterium bavaricum]